MKIKKLKKGFTLVELVVVIAIIAILSGVSVAVYAGITSQAKSTKDQTLVAQWNTIIECDSLLDDKADNVVEVQDLLLKDSFTRNDFTPDTDGYHFYWNKNSDLTYMIKDSDNSFDIYYPVVENNTNITKDSSYRLDLEYCLLTGEIEGLTFSRDALVVGEENEVTITGDSVPNKIKIGTEILNVTDGKFTVTPSATNTIAIKEYAFGSQYKYEINQLAKYMNMDGNHLQNLLLDWTSDASNRNKSYNDLLSDIETKDDALCVSAIYILGIEHFMVTNSTVLNVLGKEFSKALLQSDVLFKKINIFFNLTNTSDVPDSDFINGLPSYVLNGMNEEFEKCNGNEDVSACDIYDAFKYSIDHAEEESPVGNTYTLTANAIYKLLNIYSTSNMSLDDVKASMDRMIAKAKSEAILGDQVFTTFMGETDEIKWQTAYDYAIYCYMCMFGLMSGDSAYTALSGYFTTKEFTSLDAIGYVLGDDYLFKNLAQIHEALQNGNIGTIMYTSFSELSSNLIGGIYTNYTDEYSDMYKAIAEIFED